MRATARLIAPTIVVAMLLAMLPRQAAMALSPRRVNAPHFDQNVDWNQAGIFWFGKVGWNAATKHAPVPSDNYADVRVAYTPQALEVFVSVIDYYLWANADPQPGDDLRQYDAAELLLDTQGDRSAAPQPDDYRFLSGWRGGDKNDTRWHRQARGGVLGWDASWAGQWSDRPGSQWCGPGPNDNTGCFDYGWATTFAIPWASIGLSAPPSGKVLGMALKMYDRDDRPPLGAGSTQIWPESLSDNAPSSWGELHIGEFAYAPPFVKIEGNATIRRGEAASSVVDATVGSDGNCSGGHEGDPEGGNRGADTGLFVESQAAITDFPCFARSYLRFGLDAVPPGKVIASATLTLYHWGNAGDPSSSNPIDRPRPSYIQLLSVDGGWSESDITWNNGPLAHENLTVTRVDPLSTFPGWPGVATSWDATAAVATSYAAGQPLDVALYTADTTMHSGKYFSSSDAADWNLRGRPTLVVTWGVAEQPTSHVLLPVVRQ